MTAPYRCPTPCDEDCEIRGGGCHERHAYDKDHDPEACEALTLAGNLSWLLAAGLDVQVTLCGGAGRCCGDTAGRFSVRAAKPDPAADLSVPGGIKSHGHASPAEALAFARDWCERNGIVGNPRLEIRDILGWRERYFPGTELDEAAP